MKRTKHIGLVGWGYWGRNYPKYFSGQLGARLKWICDKNEIFLKDAKDKYPHIKTSSDIRDLGEDKQVDAVIIATPATTHYQIAEYFLKQNKDILIEKPPTDSSQTMKKLISLAQSRNRILMTGFTFIYNPAVNWIQKKLDQKYLGQVYHLEFRRQSIGPIRDDVNVAWDFAPHDLSMLKYLLGLSPVSIKADGQIWTRNKREDLVTITLRFPKKIMATIKVSWLYPIKIREVVILGSKRMVVFDDTIKDQPIRVHNMTVDYPRPEEPYGAFFRLGEISIPRIKSQDPLYLMLAHFVKCLKNRQHPKTDGNFGLEIVRYLEAIDKSLKTKKEVKLS